MTNPNNSVGTNAAYDGRTSVNAFNDVLGLLPRGVLSGWSCVPNSGLTVSVGGVSGTRDVAIAEDNNGNRTTINNIPGTPINVTMSAAPGANSRIDLIVAYADNPPTGVSTTADNPAACGLITVEGTAAATPTAPDDSDIRTAITADGASGTTAYYVVLAQVTIPTGTTDIDSGMIKAGGNSGVGSQNIDFTTFADYSLSEINTGYKWIDGKYIYKKTINTGVLPNNSTKTVAHGISNLGFILKFEGAAWDEATSYTPLPNPSPGLPYSIEVYVSGANLAIYTGTNRSSFSASYVTLYYTKS